MKRALLLLVVACSDPVEPTTAPRDAKGTAAVKPPPPPADASPGFVGVITAAESVDVAPRFQGVVSKVNVRAGDNVVEGEVVAEMDQKSMQEELRAAQAALGAAQAAARQAEVDVEDARHRLTLETKAVADGVSPKAALDEAQLAVKRAYAAASRAGSQVAAESSHVQTARDHVNDLALRSPSDGTVDRRYKDPGATVAAGMPVVRVVKNGGLRLKFAVPPDDAKGLAVGAAVHAMVDTVKTPVAATVREVAPALDPASGMILVEAELDQPPAELRPGLAATVR